MEERFRLAEERHLKAMADMEERLRLAEERFRLAEERHTKAIADMEERHTKAMTDMEERLRLVEERVVNVEAALHRITRNVIQRPLNSCSMEAWHRGVSWQC